MYELPLISVLTCWIHSTRLLFSVAAASYYPPLFPSSPSLNRYCEESLLEPVSTLLWAAPRLSSEIEELSKVCTASGNCRPAQCRYYKTTFRSTSSQCIVNSAMCTLSRSNYEAKHCSISVNFVTKARASLWMFCQSCTLS